jgi:peptidoglycan/LPS O-acetylase OafA/YrhL
MRVTGRFNTTTWLLYVLGGGAVTHFSTGPHAAIATLFGALGIIWGDRVSPIQFLCFFGTISYSLYLVHFPIGARLLNLGGRFVPPGPAGYVWLAVTFALVTALAYVMWRYIERPAQKLSSCIRYHKAAESS